VLFESEGESAVKLTPAKVTMLMLLAVAGLIGLYLVKELTAVEKKPARPTTLNIPLAVAALEPGTRITQNHIDLGPVSISELKGDMLRVNRVIVGRVVKEAIKPGSPIRGWQLYDPGENAPLLVAAGKQAIALPVATTSEMVDGLIKPNEFVDVHFVLSRASSSTVDPRIAKLGGVSMTLFKGVKVLAINRNFRQGLALATGNSVTLELAPEQTNALLVARDHGTISLTFNPDGSGDGGVAVNNADRATLFEILGLRRPVGEREPEPEKPFETDAYRGAAASTLQWNGQGKRLVRDNNTQHPSRANAVADDLEVNDVFDSGDGVRATPGDAAEAVPSVDPDIPITPPGTASGVRPRTRINSILNIQPQLVGPTAARN
jgi:pilus assembly protein CpaB